MLLSVSKASSILNVARQSGVSYEVINRFIFRRRVPHKTEITEKLKRAVAESSPETGVIGREIQERRSYAIGLILNPFQDKFTENVFRGINDALKQSRFIPILLMYDPDDHDERMVQQLTEHGVEGLIIRPNTYRMHQVVREIQVSGLPVVSVDDPLSGAYKYDFVGTDDSSGGALAAEHLYTLGHRSMAGLYINTGTLKERIAGFEEALLSCGTGITLRLLSDWDFDDDGRNLEMVCNLLADENAPTALFVSGNFMMPTVYQAAMRLGVNIPEDLSVIGFGDTEFTELLDPPATIIQQDAYGIGYQAARLLVEQIGENVTPAPVQHLWFKPEMLIRESTLAI